LITLDLFEAFVFVYAREDFDFEEGEDLVHDFQIKDNKR
jgi:hypothetical protein